MAKQTFTTGQVLTAAQITSLQQTAMGGGSTTAKTTSYVLLAADAGTTVAMNAAGSTTITVNTSLFSAGDSVFIQNWGAGTCTVTAGTATVTTHGSLALSQWEGGTLYFTSSSAAIFFDISQSTGMTNPMTTTGDTIYSSSGSTPARLGIGSTGQVLTVASGVPSWATPAGGGGMTLLSTTTLSGTSTTISSINQTYKNLYILGVGLNQGGNASYYFRLNGNDTAADYSGQQLFCSVGGSPAVDFVNSNNGDFGQLGTRTTWNGQGYFQMTINRYTETENKLISSDFRVQLTSSPDVVRSYLTLTAFNSTTAISSIKFVAGSGSHGGTIYIYGVN
jgi:hypothetical protein